MPLSLVLTHSDIWLSLWLLADRGPPRKAISSRCLPRRIWQGFGTATTRGKAAASWKTKADIRKVALFSMTTNDNITLVPFNPHPSLTRLLPHLASSPPLLSKMFCCPKLVCDKHSGQANGLKWRVPFHPKVFRAGLLVGGGDSVDVSMAYTILGEGEMHEVEREAESQRPICMCRK
ncbi:hypothetical protein FIBSPDRAFT_875243 [Athelia psychrophila]|uniref:Uncharacterized protein n=1 Tax=Athelia psychrophila TaxID=1759441 RepID=A0A165WIY0_9AGAM|nr:hypothetical protein FIBSPDRAFT_875243 [Fibularhizoctonia sp. CBS 109695]